MERKIEKEPPTLVEVVTLIHVRSTRGDGTEENPVRGIVQFWSLEGELIAEAESNNYQSLRAKGG
jgi:hypothetical protein